MNRIIGLGTVLASLLLVACGSGGSSGGPPVCATAPNAPASVTATAASSTRIDLSWDAVTAPASCTVTYSVYRSTTPGFTPGEANRVAQALTVASYADTGLFASTTYHYVVQAVDAAGSAGTAASATTPADACAAAPSAPGSLTATATSATHVNLSWSAVTPPANCTVTYTVYRSTDPAFTPGPANQVATGLTATTYGDDGLTGSTTYHYVVRAVDAFGFAGATASTATQAYVCEAAPSAPATFTATATSATHIDLSWATVTPPAHCSITYSVYRSTTSPFTPSDANRIAQGLTDTTYGDDGGLLGSTTYYYVVRAVDAFGWAEAAAHTTTQAYVCGAAPAAPGSLTATPFSPSRIDLSWNAVTPPAHCSVTYSVYRSTTSPFTPGEANRIAQGLTDITYTDQPLADGTTYYYVVQAVDAFGWTGASASAATPVGVCSGAPTAPGSLNANSASSAQIDLAWTAATAPQYCDVTYSVYRSTTPGFTPGAGNRVAMGLTATTFADHGLVASTQYHYVVEAVDAAGRASATASATTDAGSCALDAAGASWLAFVGQRSGGSGYDLYMVHQDGTCLTRVIGTAGADLWPVFRSTNALAYTRDAVGGKGIYVHDLVAGTETGPTLPANLTPAAPSYSGTRVVFEGTVSGEGRSDVYRSLSTGSGLTPLTAAPGNSGAPVFAPGGATIYFVSNRSGEYLVYSMTSADPLNTQTALPGTNGVLGRPAISPNGTLLAYARQAGGTSVIVVRTLADNSEVVVSAHGDSSPVFSADGSRLAVSSTRGGQPAIWLIDTLTGANPVQVTFPIGTEIDGQPAFRP